MANATLVLKSAKTTGNVYIRKYPATTPDNSNLVLSNYLLKGTPVSKYVGVTYFDNVRTWQFIKYSSVYGWVAGEYLTEDVTTPPTPTPTPVGLSSSKMGFHILSNANQNVLQTLKNCYRSGHAVRGVLLTRLGWNSDITAQMIKEASPSTEVMLRWFRPDSEQPAPNWDTMDGMVNAGGLAVSQYFQRFNNPDNNYAKWHQLINEPIAGNGTVLWWHGALDVADNIGKKLAVLTFPVGIPPLPTDTGSPLKDWWTRPDTLDLLRRIKRDGHALMLHQYVIPQAQGKAWDSDEWGLMRHKKFMALLPPDLRDIPIYFGEFGDIKATRGNLIDNMRKADVLMKDDTVKWAAMWTLGNGASPEWFGDELDQVIAEIEEYLNK